MLHICQFMRFPALTFLLLSALGCRTNKSATNYILDTSRFEIEEHTFKGESYVDTTYFENGNIEAISTFAYSKEGVQTKMFSGERTEFYTDGTLKSTGFYDMSYYVNCCFAGHCLMDYFYKTGQWTYYYPNGQIRAKGIYLNELHHIDTSCRGGDNVMNSRTTKDWEYYDEQGTEMEPPKQLLKELEVNDYFFFD